MKKKIIIIVVVLLLAFIAVSLTNRKVFNIFNKKDKTNTKTYDNYTTLYVLNDDDKLVGINVGDDGTIDDEVKHKWNLLTYDYHKLPKGYKSPIYVSTSLVDYKIDKNVMAMNLSDDFLYSEGRAVLECLVYNFCGNDIESLALTVDGEKITSFESMTFDYLTKDIGCNLIFETDNIFNSDDLTVIYHYEDYVLPVTYYYDCSINDFDPITYLVDKAISIDEYVSTINQKDLITYEISEKTLAFTTKSDIVLPTTVLNTLKDSISVNYDFTEISFNGVKF